MAPRRPLRAIRRALESAAAQDDAGAMARFLLLHAEWLRRTHRAALLGLVRDGDLERAWQLADAMSETQRILWHLLLAWELHGAGRAPEARATLERLQGGSLPLREAEQCELAAFLLAHVYPVDAARFENLHPALLDDWSAALLCRFLAEAGLWSAAAEVATVRHVQWDAGSSWGEIVRVLSESGELTAAQEMAWQMPDGAFRDRALKELAEVQARQGEYAAAEALALEIADADERAEALATLAGARLHEPCLREGQHPAAVANLVAALERSWPDEDPRRSLELLYQFVEAFAYPEDSSAAQAAVAGAFVVLAGRETLFEQAMRQVCRALEALAAGERPGALAALVEARRVAAEIPNSVHQALAMVAVAQALAQAGDRPAARSMFAAARQRLRRGRFHADTVLSTPRQREAGSQDVRENLLVALARAQAQVGEWRGAWRTALELGRSWKQYVTAHSLAPALTQRGELAIAWQIACRFDDDLTYSTIVAEIAGAQVRAGDWPAFWESLAAIPLIDLRAALLSEVARRQVEVGDRPAAERTLQDALALIAEQEYDCDWQPAMRQLIPEPSQFPDPELARTVLIGLLEILREKPVGAQDLKLLRAVAAALDQWGEPRVARDCLSLALDEARPWEETENETRAGALYQIACRQARRGEFAQALAIVPALEGALDRDEARARIAQAQARRGELAGAWATLQPVEEPIPLARALSTLAAAEARRGDLAAARAALTDALAAARRIDMLDSRAEAWEQIAREMLATGNAELVDQALTTARAAVGPEDEDGVILSRLAALELRAGRPELAREIAASLSHPWCRYSAFLGIAEALSEAEQRDAARSAFAAANAAAQQLEPEPLRWTIVYRLAKRQAAAGQYQEALENLGHLEDTEEEARAAVAIVQALHGDLTAACETAARIAARELQPWDTIAVAQAGAGQFAAARDSARAIWSPTSRVATLGRIARAQAQAEERAAARATLAEAVSIAHAIADESQRTAALVSLAPVQAMLGLCEQVAETAAGIRVRRSDYLRELGSALITVGDRGTFKQILLQSLDCPEEAFRFCSLLAQLYPEQDAAIAAAVMRAAGPRRPAPEASSPLP